MRKLAIALALTFTLTGCASLDFTKKSIFDGGPSVVTRTENPLGLNEQYQIEAAIAAARRPALAYMRLRQCRKSEVASFSNICGYRSVKVKIQNADRKLQAALLSVRKFVRDNPTVSGASVIASINTALADYRAELALNGVK
jgi:hypothetical protein